MTSELFDEIVAALQTSRSLVRQVAQRIPDAPGMYAIYGTVESVRQLGIPSRDPELPLFVGKADRSSLRVELRDHFTTGKTPWSTVRRSIAALLRDELKLAVGAYGSDPVDGRLFALEATSDERLTSWMGANLKLAIWVKPQGISLRGVDREVVAAFRPPLVLRGVGRPWLRLQALRTAMANEARRLHDLGTHSAEAVAMRQAFPDRQTQKGQQWQPTQASIPRSSTTSSGAASSRTPRTGRLSATP